MKYILLLVFASTLSSQLFPQHLPLKIGNQWHYAQGLCPTYENVAFAVDTVQLNNNNYFKIVCKDAYKDSIVRISYDRIEGDSTYYRTWNGNDEFLVFNFNWQDSQVVVSPASFDTTCFHIQIIHRYTTTFWGLQTYYYAPEDGYYCPDISPDTGWALSGYTYLANFGCLDTEDGLLVGAVIDGITYGTLFPVPVELLSFSSSVVDDDVTLNWITATETNNSGFQIERSKKLEARSEEWINIGFVNGNGTTTEAKVYSFKDENLSVGKYQYRLKQIDFDGTFEYSNIIEAEIHPPAKFSLEQNYPNPFNPSTKISWQSPAAGHQTLKIYDVLGNEIATLVDEFRAAGSYEVEFKSSVGSRQLASGIYFYKLQIGSFVETKKMVLIK